MIFRDQETHLFRRKKKEKKSFIISIHTFLQQMNNTYAHMVNDESDSIPIGTSKWIFSHGFCGEQAGVAQSLTLSQCAKNKEFTCDDGTCIPINQVIMLIAED